MSMKNKALQIILFLLIFVLLVCLLFHCCSVLLINRLYEDLGSRNWKIALNFGYEIQQVNSKKIVLVKDGWNDSTNIVIPFHVTFYCYNSQYAGLICRESPRNAQTEFTSTGASYYLIDMKQDKLFGPFTENEYIEYCGNNQISDLDQWISTNPRPDEAVFE